MAIDPSIYEAARRSLLNNYAQQAALNAYQRYLAETRGQRALIQLEEATFGRTPTGKQGELPALTSSYARRGLTGMGTRSGIYNRALQEYGRQRARQTGYAKEDIAQQLRGFDLAATQAQETLQTGLTNLEQDKARQISQDAQALLNLR